jgi:glycosyltransferase involved in cell wall biosynthesis
MDISVIIPSRNRVRGLTAAITSLQHLESGKHRVRYAIGCDDDDFSTVSFAARLQAEMPHKVAVKIGPRPLTLGGLVNEMADHLRADVYTAVCDDIVCVTPEWDDVIAKAALKTLHGVFWWQNAFKPRCLWAAVTEKWRAAADGVFVGHYPFWFDDLCLEELWAMTTGADPIKLKAKLADRPVNTMRMRELAWWYEFFTKTRPMRARQAHVIAEKLGLPKPRYADKINEEWEKFFGRPDPEFHKQIENGQGDMGPPDPSYIQAKERAMRILADLGSQQAA